jgi:hypothetical protein
LVHTQLVTISSRSRASFELRNITKFSILLAYKSTTTMYRRNKLNFYMLLVKISSKLEGINLIRNIYDNKLIYFLLINNKLLYMIIFLLSYRAKSSELGLAQDQVVFQSSYIRRSYSAHFLLSRSRVELRNEMISSRSRVSSFSYSPSCYSVVCNGYRVPKISVYARLTLVNFLFIYTYIKKCYPKWIKGAP